MATWQFWTLIGVLCFWGVYVTTMLDRIYFVIERCEHALDRINEHVARIPPRNDPEY